MTALLLHGTEEHLHGDGNLPEEMRLLMPRARDASNFLKALSNENRLLLLCLLAERERSVTELEEILSLRQANVSQQLARLRLNGMVEARRDGKMVHYRLANEDVRRVLSVVYEIFCAGIRKSEQR